MSQDAFALYDYLRESILPAREQLIARLREIAAALGAMGFSGRAPSQGPRALMGRVRNAMSLKETVLKIIEGKSMTKHEILDAVLRSGYQFSTNDPLNSLGV